MKPRIYRSLLVVAFALFIPTLSMAQRYDPQKVGKRAGNAYGKALEQADMGNYKDALAGMAEAIRLDSN